MRTLTELLDAEHPDHQRLTPWVEAPQGSAAAAHRLCERTGRRVERVYTCRARNRETLKVENLATFCFEKARSDVEAP